MPQPLLYSQPLTDIELLRSHFGEVSSLSLTPMDTIGYSGARFSSLSLSTESGATESLILKEVNLDEDWFSYRTQDKTGREAAILVEPCLAEITEIFHSPYRLIQMAPGKIAILMDDLSSGLFPNEKKPLSMMDQDQMLNKLALLHATYWDSKPLEALTWLHHATDFVYLMGPLDHLPFNKARSDKNIQRHIKEGWEVTLPLLPSAIRDNLLKPPRHITARWAALPKTLVHGDTKVANFAKSPDGELSILDWAFAGYAPCTFDIGWFIAVNASRLAESKEAVLKKYRHFLERHLGQTLEDKLWSDLEQAGIVCGAFMLLWSKGTALANGHEGAELEWKWWIDRLDNWSRE